MASKAYLDRQRSVTEILSLLDTRSEDVLRGLEEFFAPDLEEGERMPDFAPLLKLARRALARRLRELGEVDDEWETRCDLERGARIRLKKMVTAFRRLLNKLRMTLRGLRSYRPTGRKTVLHDELPRDPVGLLGASALLFAWIADDETVAEIRKKREKEMEEVRAAVFELSHAEAARVRAQSTRQQVLEVFNVDFVDLADLFHALYRLAGLRKAARHLRPSKQEKGLTMGVMKRRRAARAAHAKKAKPES